MCRRSWPIVKPDEGPTRLWIRVRAALTGQVGQEVQPFAAGGDVGGRLHQVTERDAGREGVAQPAQAAGRREHDRHHVPSTGHGVAEGMHSAARLV